MTTRTDKQLRIKLILAVLLALTSLGVQAAVTTETYKNGSDITNLFFWSDDAMNMTFAGVDLSDVDLAGWTTALNSGDRLVLEGPKVKKSLGKFEIDFDYSVAPFTFQFAEVMYDSVASIWTVEKTGNIEFNGTKLVTPYSANPLSVTQLGDIGAHFSPAPAVVPIPSSVVMMVSALGFMGVAARRIPTTATPRA